MSDSFVNRIATHPRVTESELRSPPSQPSRPVPRGPAGTPNGQHRMPPPSRMPPPPPLPPTRAIASRSGWRQPVATALIGLVLCLQILGTMAYLPWTPGLFIGGGLDRLVEFGAANGYALARAVRLIADIVICVFWAFMLIASSRLGADVPPKLLPGERGWQFNQKRVAYLGPLLVLMSGHVIGALIAKAGFWPLAIPFELGGHIGMAGLLYVILIPEGRHRLIVIEDVQRGGVSSRVHVSSGFYSRNKGRRWLVIRHDQLRGAELNDPLWARIFDTAHLELVYVDANWQPTRQVVRCIGTKDDLASIVSYLNGSFLARRPANYGQPVIRMNTDQPPIFHDEEWKPF